MSNKKKLSIDTSPDDDRSLIPDEDAQYEEEQARRALAAEQDIEAEAELARKQEIEQKQAYEEKLRREKVELLQKKQGIFSEDESTDEQSINDEAPAVKPSVWKRLENFWYHYKIQFIVAVIAIGFGGYMIYDLVTKVEPDITVISVVDNGLSHRMGSLEDYFERYYDDLNGDGEVYVQVIHVPMDPSSTDTNAQNYATKLYSTLQSGRTVLILADNKSAYSVEQVSFQNLTERYPEHEFVTEKGISMTCKKLKQALNWAQMPEDMVLMIRKPVKTLSADLEDMEKTCDEALALLDKMLEDTK